jgi:hypothetical protein
MKILRFTVICFGIGIAIGIGFWMHRIPIAIPIPIPNGVDFRIICRTEL